MLKKYPKIPKINFQYDVKENEIQLYVLYIKWYDLIISKGNNIEGQIPFIVINSKINFGISNYIEWE